MNLAVRIGVGKYVVNYSWLPAWIGLNSSVMERLSEHINAEAIGKEHNEESLHDLVVDSLCIQYPNVRGLREHLQSLKQVSDA